MPVLSHGSDLPADAARVARVLGAEAVFAALFLGLADADGRTAFDLLWSLQLTQGPAKGAWPWFNLDLAPRRNRPPHPSVQPA